MPIYHTDFYRKICKHIIILGIGFFIISNALFASDKNDYQAAAKAITDGHYQKYQNRLAKLDDSILKLLLESQYLLKHFDSRSSKTIESFLKRNADFYTSNQIRTKYLNQLLANNDTAKFLKFYKKDTVDIELECHFLTHTISATNLSDEQNERIKQIWLSADSRPDSCSTVFKLWQKAGKLTNQLVWDRIERAMTRSRYKFARYIAKSHLPKKEIDIVDLWIEVRNSPSKKIANTRFSDTERAGKILADGLEQLARTSPASADSLWKKTTSSNPKLKRFNDQVYAGIGFRAAINHLPGATGYLKKASFDDEKIRHWAIRTALREHKWSDVIDFYYRLTEEEKQSPNWRYWHARALGVLGKPEQATKIFNEISNQRDYYSFLAADKINADYQMNNQPITLSTETLENTRAFQLAKLLYQVDTVEQMRRQWNWAIRDLDTEELLAAAKLASKWNYHDRAIITAGKAKYYDDVNLRFPVIHKSSITKSAKKNQLPTAYVYGIMRQESAFMESVKSSAGALGLMQIMPATGKLIWKKQNKANYRSSILLNPTENIQAGTYYLRDMLNIFDDHYAMATAAYNAGPNRPIKWRPNHSTAADIWIENIPFKETRGYVKNVLAYMAIYDNQLGNIGHRISQLLPKIHAG